MQKHDDSTGRIIRYSSHPNDIRVAVNYYGNVPKQRVKTAKERYIMRDGMNVNRQLPVPTRDEFSFDV